MNQKPDIELPLLIQGKRSFHDEDSESQYPLSKNLQNPPSHFTEYIEDSKHPDKYAPPAPFLQWLTFSDMLPYVRKINKSDSKLKFQDLPKPEGKFSVGNKLLELDSHWNQELQAKTKLCYGLIQNFLWGIYPRNSFIFN